MKIATWNVNSIRSRLDRALAWLKKRSPDVLCLQELKVEDAKFPHDAFEAAGYHATVWGQRTYNGVALLSKEEPRDVQRGFDDGDDNGEVDAEARAIGARFEDVTVWSLYVPNGRQVGTDKYAYKLRWLARLRAYLEDQMTPEAKLVLAGDFNIATDEKDVARPDAWEASVLFHPEMCAALRALMDWGLVDTFRLHHPDGATFSWWDYRRLAFPKNDGLKIDHILATPPLAALCTGASIDRDERKGEKPSDHAPVIAEFDLG